MPKTTPAWKPRAMPVRKSRPDAPAVSAATKAPGMMLVPGWVSMRKVSHLPPAIAISAFANAAPPLVTLAPSTMMVAPFFTPASSSPISFTAWRPPGVSEPSSTDASPWSVTPLARSTTSGGRSSKRSPTTHCASCRLSDAIVFVSFVVPRDGASRCRPGGRWREARARPGVGSTGGRLPQGRERRRDQHLVFLPDRPDARLRRPLTTLPRLFPNARALVRVLVRPHVHELVEPAELARPAGRQRRELLPDGNRLAPRLQHRCKVAGRVGVDAHLVEVAGAEVAAAERLHERRRDHDVGLLLDDQIAAAGQLLERRVLCHRVAHRSAVLQVFVRPDVNDLVERAEVGVPEGAERRVLFAERLPLGEAVLELGHGSGAQGVGANFVDHLLLLLDSYGLNTANTLSEFEIHDSRNTDSSGLRRSSAIAPTRQNQFKSS